MHTERGSYGTGLCLVQEQCGARRKREGKWHGDMTAQLAAASSDRRRSTALARWLRATTLNSKKGLVTFVGSNRLGNECEDGRSLARPCTCRLNHKGVEADALGSTGFGSQIKRSRKAFEAWQIDICRASLGQAGVFRRLPPATQLRSSINPECAQPCTYRHGVWMHTSQSHNVTMTSARSLPAIKCTWAHQPSSCR